MKNAPLIFLLSLLFSPGFAQHQPTESYIVSTYDDTTYCDEIKLKQNSVTCRSKTKKTEILNENVRRIYMPVAASEYQTFFNTYGNLGKKTLYPYTPGQVKEVVAENVYPRFFDLRPLDAEKDFWTRGLFEILAQNNGYKLCKLKKVQSSTPTFATESNELDHYILFREFEATGEVLTRSNYRTVLAKLVSGCTAAENELKNEEVNHLKDVNAFLTVFARCN